MSAGQGVPLGLCACFAVFSSSKLHGTTEREREREGGGREESATQHTLEELLQEPGLVCNRVPAKVNGLVGEKGQLVQRRDDLAVLCIARERCVCVCVNVCE